eukprot:scaffold88036_cov61-Phaeocystis_antarctica.AAC.6
MATRSATLRGSATRRKASQVLQPLPTSTLPCAAGSPRPLHPAPPKVQVEEPPAAATASGVSGGHAPL